MSKARQWWDEVPYNEDAKPLWSMQIDAPEAFSHPCGFIKLRERHRVKAVGIRWELDKPANPQGE